MDDPCDDNCDADKPYKKSKHIDSMDNMSIHDAILHYLVFYYKYLITLFVLIFYPLFCFLELFEGSDIKPLSLEY